MCLHQHQYSCKPKTSDSFHKRASSNVAQILRHPRHDDAMFPLRITQTQPYHYERCFGKQLWTWNYFQHFRSYQHIKAKATQIMHKSNNKKIMILAYALSWKTTYSTIRKYPLIKISYFQIMENQVICGEFNASHWRCIHQHMNTLWCYLEGA